MPADLCRWLGGLDAERDPPAVLLQRIVAALNVKMSDDGLGALRFWGQTGDRPSTWLAAADPVFLEARLKTIIVREIAVSDLSREDMREVYGELQRQLGSPGGFGFSCIGRVGYLTSAEALPTATLPPEEMVDCDPAAFLPDGAAATFHRLHSEIQMTLHASPVQARRAAAHAPPLNALWVWGGGRLSGTGQPALPRLFADDPLLRGYWNRCDSASRSWPGTIAACAASAGPGFVAATPAVSVAPSDCVAYLEDVKALLKKRQLRRATLLFRDGVSVRAVRRLWRPWRRRPPHWLPSGPSVDAN